MLGTLRLSIEATESNFLLLHFTQIAYGSVKTINSYYFIRFSRSFKSSRFKTKKIWFDCFRERGSSNYVNEIIAIDSNGDFLWSYGRDKTDTKFNRGKLRSIAVDNPRNRILALCKNTVYVFSIEGRYLSRFTPSNENDFKLAVDSNICVTDEGLVLVTGEDRVYMLFVFDGFGRVKDSLKLSSKAGGEFSPSGIAYNHCTQEILIADKGTNCLLVCARDKARNRYRFIRKIKFAERYTGGGVVVMRNGHIAVVNRGTNKIIII